MISEGFAHWLGLCPKAPAVRAMPAVIDGSPVPAFGAPPDGGAGGPGTIQRGTGAALSGLKTLIHNPQLLWFSLLVGLVLAAHLIAQWELHQFSITRWVLYAQRSITLWPFYADPVTADVLTSLVQTFVIEFLTVFCVVFLLAGLTLSLSSKGAGPVSFFQDLAMAGKYKRSLTMWSVTVALAGTLLYIGYVFSWLLDSTWLQPYNIVSDLSRTLTGFLLSVQSQFPFNFVLEPAQYVPILGPGWDWWFISFALIDTLVLSAITVFLFVLTLFVVPLLVIEERDLREAVLGSCALMKNIWGEVAACVLGLGMVVFAASLAYLLFRFSGVGYEWWDSAQMYTSFTFPSDAWIAAALLYVLAVSGIAFVVATVGGIATLDLYRSAKIHARPDPLKQKSPN